MVRFVGSPSSQHVSRSSEFHRQAQGIVEDLNDPNAWIYWTDFLISTFVGYGLASVFLAHSINSPIAWGGFLGAVFALYRSSMFMHEVVHLPRGSMKGFRFTWNLLAGVPMMIPSFTYRGHLRDHRNRLVNAQCDRPRAAPWNIRSVSIFFQPILVFLRYLLLTPASFCNGRLRRWTMAHASSLVIGFENEPSSKVRQRVSDTTWEVMTWLAASTVMLLLVARIVPAAGLSKVLLLAVSVLVINQLRVFAMQRSQGVKNRVPHLEPFLDSTHVLANWLTELICPLGLRYHALHHRFPRIPYHNRRRAHARLSMLLAAGSTGHDRNFENSAAVSGDRFHGIDRDSLISTGLPDDASAGTRGLRQSRSDRWKHRI